MADERFETVRAAFTSAMSFHDVAVRCFKPAPGLTIEPVPMVVNVAFACELYLKAGLIAADKVASGHPLDQLFGALPDADQAAIEAIYHTGQTEADVPLRPTLAEIAMAFVQWRYAYEAPNLKVRHGAILRLASALLIWMCRTDPRLLVDIDRFNRLLGH